MSLGDMQSFLAWIGAGISIVGTARYIRGIIKEGTRPRMASWIAWLVANSIFAFVALQDHAYLAASINGLAALCNLVVCGLGIGLRAGDKPQGLSDRLCLVLACACVIVVVLMPGAGVMGGLLAMLANFIATWPTLHHAWAEPHAETWQLFAANAGASALSFIGIAGANGMHITTLIGPFAAIAGNITLTMVTLGRQAGPEVAAELHILEEELEEVLEPEVRATG
jgi:hypothetical protein